MARLLFSFCSLVIGISWLAGHPAGMLVVFSATSTNVRNTPSLCWSFTVSLMCMPRDPGNLKPLKNGQVHYDPTEVKFEELLAVFFGRIDPTQKDGQGGDRGTQYRTGVYCHTDEQMATVSSAALLCFF